jgi:transposase
MGGSLYKKDERDFRFTMGAIKRSPAATPARRKTRTSQTGHTLRIKWNPLDIKDRRTVVGFTGSVSTLSNLSSIFSDMGAFGYMGQGLVENGAGFKGAREDRHNRVFHRRYFCKRQKRGSCVGKTKRGKGTKIMAIADSSGLPVAVRTAGANTHEVKLVEETIHSRHVKQKPKHLIGDRAYDSDPLDDRLKKKKIELIAPHRTNRRKRATQDGRKLRRYCRRWKVERLFAWIFNFRKTVVRYEYHVENYLGFVQFACILILIKQF